MEEWLSSRLRPNGSSNPSMSLRRRSNGCICPVPRHWETRLDSCRFQLPLPSCADISKHSTHMFMHASESHSYQLCYKLARKRMCSRTVSDRRLSRKYSFAIGDPQTFCKLNGPLKSGFPIVVDFYADRLSTMALDRLLRRSCEPQIFKQALVDEKDFCGDI